MSGDDAAGDVVKWYTRARKFPQLLGRFADGNKIPGGPYTITQAFGAGGALLIAKQTAGIWARYGLLGNALLLGAVVYGLVLGLGRIPPGARNPMSIIAGIGHAAFAPRQGRIAGRPVRMRRPRRVQHRVVIRHPDPVITPAPSIAAPPAVSSPRPEPVGAPAPSAVPPQTRHQPTRHEPTRHQPTRTVPPAASRRPRAPAAATRPALSGVQLLLATLPTDPKDC